jgi:WD40 repeat protein
MNLVQSSFEANNVGRGVALLELGRPGPGEPDRRGFEWHYWRRRAHPERRAWKISYGQSYMLTGLSPDGRFLADAKPASKAGQAWIRVLETDSSRLRCRLPLEMDAFPGPTLIFTSFSEDGSRLAAAWTSSTSATVTRSDLAVWDVSTGKEILRRTERHVPAAGTIIAFHQVVLSGDGGRVAWSISPRNFGGPAGRGPDPRMTTAAGGLELRVMVLEVATGEPLLDRSWDGSESRAVVDLSRDGGTVAVVLNAFPGQRARDRDRGASLGVYDVRSGRERMSIKEAGGMFFQPGLDATGRLVAAGRVSSNSDIHLQVFRCEDGSVISSRSLRNDRSALGGSVRFSPDGRRLVVRGSSQIVVTDAMKEGAPVLEFEVGEVQTGIIDAVVLPGGRRMRASTSDGTLREWDLPDGDPKAALSGRVYEGVRRLAVSPDGTRVARMAEEGRDRSLIVEDAKAGEILARIGPGPRSAGTVDQLWLGPGGRRLVLLEAHSEAGADRLDRLRIWDVPSSKLLADLGPERLGGAAGVGVGLGLRPFSPDGEWLALARGVIAAGARARAALRPREVCVINTGTGEISRTLIAPPDALTSSLAMGKPCFSPEGALVACGVSSRRGDGPRTSGVLIWNRSDGRVVRSLRAATAGAPDVAFSRDGRRLFGFVASMVEQEILIWDLDRSDDPLRLPWHGTLLAGLVPSPDGRRFVTITGSIPRGSEIRLWDAGSGRDLASWGIGNRGVSDALFTPEGHRLIVCDYNIFKDLTSHLVVYDATPLDPGLDAFELVRARIREVPQDREPAAWFAALSGYDPAILREAEKIAAEWPESPVLLRRSAEARLNEAAGPPTPEAARAALGYLDRAVAQDPEAPDVLHLRGRALYYAGRLAEARESLLRAIALHATDADPFAFLAMCEAKLGRRAEAEKALADFLRLWTAANPKATAPPPLLGEVKALLSDRPNGP